MVLDDWWMDPLPKMPEQEEVEKRIVQDDEPGSLRLLDENLTPLNPRLRPYYAVAEAAPYRMYHDLDRPEIPVW
jgi:hypothetical protein